MNQREEIKALREEIAELRKQLSAMAVAMAELAAHQPVQYVRYVPTYCTPTWPITYSTTSDVSPTFPLNAGTSM